MFLPPMPPFLPPMRFGLACAAPPCRLQNTGRRSGLRYFRNRPLYPPGGGGSDPPPDDNGEVFNPLSANEEKAYLILAGIGCLPFLLLLLLVILTHSPFMAN